MGRTARPLHDPGNNGAIERGSNLQAARRGGLMKPAKPAGERKNTAALTPSLGTRSLLAVVSVGWHSCASGQTDGSAVPMTAKRDCHLRIVNHRRQRSDQLISSSYFG